MRRPLPDSIKLSRGLSLQTSTYGRGVGPGISFHEMANSCVLCSLLLFLFMLPTPMVAQGTNDKLILWMDTEAPMAFIYIRLLQLSSLNQAPARLPDLQHSGLFDVICEAMEGQRRQIVLSRRCHA
eukprot:scaffold411009_cov14-Prasinocladus_malaysianus.AAC.1